MTSPFLRPDSPVLADVFADGTVHLLEVAGVAEWSVRRIATWMKVTHSAVLGVHSRARVLELVNLSFADRWLQWSAGVDWWTDRSSPPLRLPISADERHGVRVLRALEQLSIGEQRRGNPVPLMRLDRIRETELELVGLRLGHGGDDASLDASLDATALLALLDGVRAAMAHPESPMDETRARGILARALRARDPGDERPAA